MQTPIISRRETPRAVQLADLQRNLATVRSRIDIACQTAGRAPGEVRLLPVSKTVDERRIRLVRAEGYQCFGENKVQEALHKADALTDADIRWSIIGHLQTNKAKYVARFAHEFQALDRLKLAAALDRWLQREGRSLDVYIQVNSSGEASKYGLAPADVLPFVNALPVFSTLNVKGLMTLAVFSPDQQRVRQCFRRMRELRDQLRQDAHGKLSIEELSMGMSGDLEIAIEEGATMVRVGQAIFGARQLPDSYYWPGEGG